jgi:CAAX protease family protein
MSEDYGSRDSLTPEVVSGPAPASRGADGFRMVFLGPNGIRAGWRLLIFVLVVFLLRGGLNFTLRNIAPVHNWLNSQPKDVFTPAELMAREGIAVVLLFAACGIMALIEKRSFGVYGMPAAEAFGKRFWQGVPLGFIMLSLLLAMMAALHGFSLDGVGVGGPAAIKYGMLYFIGFILVGIFEEFSFRGYLQYTLGSGIGFWPAALLLACLFGYIHGGNPGEAKLGLVMAGSFGLVAAFALYRTGNLWVPIGMHASWDWGETYFYGTPDSGLLARGHFLNSAPNGPTWLSGGTVGPEGSLLVFAILILWAIAIHFLFPAKAKASA